MSEYIDYFLQPHRLDEDFPELDPWVPLADPKGLLLQSKARRMVTDLLAVSQFPDFHARHPLNPGPTVPTTPMASPLLSPAAHMLRIPTHVSKVWLYRDPASGLPLADKSPFAFRSNAVLLATRKGSGSSPPHPSTAGGQPSEDGGDANGVASSPMTRNLSAETKNSARGLGDTGARDTMELTAKQKRYLGLAAELIERSKLPLDFLLQEISPQVTVTLFAFILATRDGQFMPFAHVLVLYHRWVLHCYGNDRLPLVDWTTPTDCHFAFVTDALVHLDALVTTSTNGARQPGLARLRFQYRLECAEYLMAALRFDHAIPFFEASVAILPEQGEPGFDPQSIRQHIEDCLAACQAAAAVMGTGTNRSKSLPHPSLATCPPSGYISFMEQTIAMVKEAPLGDSLLQLQIGAMPAMVYVLLNDHAHEYLSQAYRYHLVQRLVSAKLVVIGCVVDLTNSLLGFYESFGLDLKLQPCTIESFRDSFPVDKQLLLKTYMSIVTNYSAWNPPVRETVINHPRFAWALASLIDRCESFLNEGVAASIIEVPGDAVLREQFQKIRARRFQQSTAIPLTPEIVAPSSYKPLETASTTLFNLATDLMVKECYPLAGSIYYRISTMLNSSPNLGLDPASDPRRPTVNAESVDFFLKLNRLLWALADLAGNRTAIRAVPPGKEADIWTINLPQVLQSHATTPFPIVLRLALYCLHFREFSRFIQVIQWISGNRTSFIQDESQMRALGVLPGIGLIMEKFRQAAPGLEEQLFNPDGSVCLDFQGMSALVKNIPPPVLIEIRKSACQTVQIVRQLGPQTRALLFQSLSRYLQDPFTLFLLMGVYTGLTKWPCLGLAIEQLGCLPLITANPQEAQPALKDDYWVQWVAALHTPDTTMPQILDTAAELLEVIGEALVKTTTATELLPPHRFPLPNTLRCRILLLLGHIHHLNRNYRACIGHFVTAFDNYLAWQVPPSNSLIAGERPKPANGGGGLTPPPPHTSPLLGMVAWQDYYLMPAYLSCMELGDPFMAVLVGQLSLVPEAPTMFSFLDRYFALPGGPLEQSRWELIWDLRILEYVIYYASRNGHDELARKLTTHIATLSASRSIEKPWLTDSWLRQKLWAYLSTALSALINRDPSDKPMLLHNGGTRPKPRADLNNSLTPLHGKPPVTAHVQQKD
ncbi:hypothetical protein BJ085DRAFT_34710 [Dimargaris cristalligena]|uniref:Uncharacterized protein n=1 Tax=Dimargaris cristalligena TaxID=215637 RepID=A0A4P9ZSI4_9FUNG|nr:hypothetical protein BJ085DRAFT_34710 [Dimargaris cristalligena]|eukprot:RKP35771.1 hypothetical protein BJ085DRAFT_34710 [Dimargaris cristalligena]